MAKELQQEAPHGSVQVGRGWLCHLSPHRGALGAMVCTAKCYAEVPRHMPFPGASKTAGLDGALSPVQCRL